MGKKSTPKAPETPDYVGAAKEQGQANLDAMRTNAEVTNSNQVTPYGSQMFTKDPNSDQWTSTITLSPEQKQLYDNMTAGQLQLGDTANGLLGRVTDAYKDPFSTAGMPDRVNSVSAPNYSMYSDNLNLQDYGASPDLQSYASAPNMQGVSGLQQYNGNANLQGMSRADLQRYQADPNMPVSSLDFSAAGDLPTMDQFKQQQQDAQDAYYRQSSSQLDPQFDQLYASKRNELINSGLSDGTEAYRNAMDDFARQRTSAYGDARDRSIIGGYNTASTLSQNSLANRAQMLSQILQGGQFANNSAQQNFQNQNFNTGSNNDLAFRTTGFNNDVGQQQYQNQNTNTTGNNDLAFRSTGFNNDASQQNFANASGVTAANNDVASQRANNLNTITGLNNDNAMTRANYTNDIYGRNNQLSSQRFADQLTGANFQNQQRGAALDEAAYLRAQPLNEYNSLMTGAQVTNPTFRGTGQVAPVDAAPVFAGAQAQGQSALDLYNTQMANRNSLFGGIAGLAGSLGGGWLSSLGGKK